VSVGCVIAYFEGLTKNTKIIFIITMTSPSAALMQSIRSGTTHFNAMSPKDRIKLIGIMGYCTLAFSAPFAGAAEMSRRTRDDTTYAKM
jgi:hypothetical protein